MNERYVLLIGAMKAGTTALYHALAAHPSIAACREKEPAFWIRDEERAGGMEAYRALWDVSAKPDACWRIEASTGYSKVPLRPSPAPLLRRQPAEFRFVYLVRNPIRRIRSQYEHALAEGWIQRPMHEGLEPQALWFSNYHLQLRPYIAAFGREAVLVLSHEELRADPAAGLARVCRFLELDPAGIPPTLARVNDSDVYRSRRLQRLLATRGLGPAEWQQQPEPDLPTGEVLATARRLAELLGQPARVTAALEDLARSVTPSPAHEQEIHAALDADLRRFEEEWGIDAWSGRRHADSSPAGSTSSTGRTPPGRSCG